MSILYSSDAGWVISHPKFIKQIYKNVLKDNNYCSLQLKAELFKIVAPFLRHNQNADKYYNSNLKRKRKKCDYGNKFDELQETVDIIRKKFETFSNETTHIFEPKSTENVDNKEIQTLADICYNECSKTTITTFGSNGIQASTQNINSSNYIFPENCKFYSKNITEINDYLSEQYDLILLDPPWWNKHIRRKKGRSNQGYDMMYNLDLTVIPIDKLLSKNGLVVIWCTNSPQHYSDLVDKVFKSWGIEKIAVWYWIKVTTSGEPICKFSEPPQKQPFEQLIFARRKNDCGIEIPDQKLVVSVPSALNSHKPPLTELLANYIQESAKCLEIFARYLLPGWTSWGLEAIKLQHECLYEVYCLKLIINNARHFPSAVISARRFKARKKIIILPTRSNRN